MNRNPKVSIIIPLYNQERYLSACIKSLQNQTYKNIEIIIVNDGSKNKCTQIASDIVSSDDRIKLINKENEGTSYARRDGYLAAEGEYISFVDDDDLMPADAIEVMVNEIEEKGTDVVLGSVAGKIGFYIKKKPRTIDGFQHGGILIKQPELFEKFYISFFGVSCFPVSIWGKLYRKTVVDKAYRNTELFSPQIRCMAGDEYFNLKLFPFLNSIFWTDKLVYYYRCGGTVDHFNRFFPEIFYLSEVRLKILDQINYDKAYRPLYIEYVNCFYYHAEQMLMFNKAEKGIVIDFFKEELFKREAFLNRLADYFSEHHVEKEGAELIISRDYEGMYNFAKRLVGLHFGTLKNRFKRYALRIIDFLN